MGWNHQLAFELWIGKLWKLFVGVLLFENDLDTLPKVQ